MNKYLQLFSTCKLVKGYSQSAIYDLERNDFSLIPNDLYNLLLEDFSMLSISQVIEKHLEFKDIITEYIDFLISKEYAFITSESSKNLFPPLFEYRFAPEEINNSIISLDDNSYYPIPDTINQLSELGCYHLEARIYGVQNSIDQFKEIIDSIKGTRVQSIDFYIKYNSRIKDHIIKESDLPIINVVNFFEAPERSDFNKVRFFKQALSDESHCGNVIPEYFTINNELFNESLRFNTCLNKKVSISKEGNIKNCPAFKNSFGNIEDTKLKSVLINESFTSKWLIKKDSIDICSDCEYRHMCTDCRAFVQDDNNEFSHPKNCKYNPYQAKWANEEGYIPVTSFLEKNKKIN